MKNYSYPEPPNPDDHAYINNAKLYNRDMYRWACTFKAQLQNKDRSDRPAAKNFVASDYTTTSTLSGTSTLDTTTAVLCTLIDALRSKGILTSVINNQ